MFSPVASCDARYSTDSEVENENTFMQLTMDDIGNATVDIDSFCRAGGGEETGGEGGGGGQVYYTKAYKENNRETCSRQPLTR